MVRCRCAAPFRTLLAAVPRQRAGVAQKPAAPGNQARPRLLPAALAAALLVVSAGAWGAAELTSYQSPPWASLQLEETPTRIRLPFKDGPDRSTLELNTIPDTLTPHLKTRLEPDCLVIDSREVKSETPASVQLRITGFDEKSLTGRDYTLYVDTQGPVGTNANFYYEGRTADGKHYWKRLEVRCNGRRVTYAFDQTVPTDLQEFHLRSRLETKPPRARRTSPMLPASAVGPRTSVGPSLRDWSTAWRTTSTPGRACRWSLAVPALTPGEYHVVGRWDPRRPGGRGPALPAPSARVAAWVLDRRNNDVSQHADLKLRLLEKIDLATVDRRRFVNVGDLSIGELGGRTYIQTGETAGERFAVHLELPEEHGLYCLEWDFPDDRKRTVDIVAHSALGASGEYELQTGYLIGDEYPSSGTMLTQRCLYWNRAKDVALVFMSARPGGAAAAEVRVYQVEGGLPAAEIHTPTPVGGWTRPLGIYSEDPAINYDYGYDSGQMPEFETMLDRLSATMKYTGQNLLAYPVVWYNGMIGPTYMPRVHPPKFMDAILTQFDEEGLEFMATINQNNVPDPSARVTRQALDEGTLYDSEFTMHRTGTPHPGGWHGSPPNFNPMHPAAQKLTLESPTRPRNPRV